MQDLQSNYGFLSGTLLGGALGLATVYYGHAYKDGSPRPLEEEPDSNEASSTHKISHSMQKALDDEILSEQFTRNVQFFGSHGQQQIHSAFVVVVGLGVSDMLDLLSPLLNTL